MKKFSLLFSLLLLASCGGGTSTSSSVTSDNSKTELTSTTYASGSKEVADAESIDSGMYMQGKTVLELDKAKKKIVSYDFGMDYNKLLAKDGTINFEASITFIEYREHGNAIRFVHGDNEYTLFRHATNGNLLLSSHSIKEETTSSTYVSVYPLPDFIMPTYGSYVSNEQEQYKVDEKGERIANGEGGFIKENFYLFLDLDKTSAKLYVGENSSTHKDTPLHEISGYTLSYNTGGLAIKIPHKDGEFACTLTITSSTVISFVNSSEKYGDYSGSGKFALIEK